MSCCQGPKKGIVHKNKILLSMGLSVKHFHVNMTRFVNGNDIHPPYFF